MILDTVLRMEASIEEVKSMVVRNLSQHASVTSFDNALVA